MPVFKFPEVKIKESRMMMFRTPFPKWDREKVTASARLFGIDGDVQENGFCLIVSDKKSYIEIFKASNSIRWTDLAWEEEESEKPVKLPDRNEALNLAKDFLQNRKLDDKRTKLTDITYTEVSRYDQKQKGHNGGRTALHMNYGFYLDNFPVMGPGAKMQVTIGSNEKVVEMYKFWREPVADNARDIIKPEDAIEQIRNSPSYVDLQDKESRVTFKNIRLGYYALPPREMQGYLIPVYEFEGAVSTPYLDRYNFTEYVLAVRISPVEVKRLGAIFGEDICINMPEGSLYNYKRKKQI
ncbi:MAG: hypothetical protein ACFFD4_24155 [Candidatus Odinarchaeota archaeon]